MAKVASKDKRILDIVSMLEKGLERKQILQKLAKTCKVSARTLDNETKEAKTILAERNKKKEQIRQDQTEQELKESLSEAIKSDLELEAILCTIATGSIKIEEIIAGDAVLRGVTPYEQISAIDKIFKKRGSNAPTKVANTNEKGEYIAPTPQIVINQYNGDAIEIKENEE